MNIGEKLTNHLMSLPPDALEATCAYYMGEAIIRGVLDHV
jgi:hypothetical protein